MRPDRFGRGAGRRRGSPFDRTDERLRRLAGGFDVDRPADEAFVGDVIPFADPSVDADPELAALASELVAAGTRARRDDPAIGGDLRPSPTFAADLRARLLAGLPSAENAIAAPSARPALAAAATTAASAGAWAGRVPVTTARNDDQAQRWTLASATPRIRWRLFDQVTAPRWTALAAAAVIVFAAFGLSASRLAPVAPRIASAVGATVSHDGLVRTAAAGGPLLVGDTVSVGDGGSATLQFGASEARLAAGAVVRIGRVDAEGIGLGQLAGRVYHRVDLPTGTSYVVTTASIAWTAHGTAFDLDREPLTSGRSEQVTLTAIQHAVELHGPDVDGTVGEGRRAVVILGGETPDVATTAVPGAASTDPWLIANGRLDLAQGRPLGILATLDIADGDPTDSPAPESTSDASSEPIAVEPNTPSTNPDATPAPTPTLTAKPDPTRTPPPTPRPTRTPEPTPKPTPKPATLDLTALACDGGVLLDWSAYGGDGFARSVVLRSSSESIPAAWPPSGGAIAVDSASTTNQAKTDGHHTTPDGAATVFYRALVLGGADQVLGFSPVRSATTHGIEPLGGLAVTPGDTTTTFGWTAFGGPSDCFTTYKLVWSATSENPSYTGNYDGAIAVAGQTTTETTAGTFASGTHVRVQAIRITSLGKFIVAETDVQTIP
jgi:outer membrane biosynthesis protein TonB